MMYHEDRGWGIDTSGSGDGAGNGDGIGDRLSAIEARLAEIETAKGEQ